MVQLKNKTHLKQLISNLQTEGMTNIWDALKCGYEQCLNAKIKK